MNETVSDYLFAATAQWRVTFAEANDDFVRNSVIQPDVIDVQCCKKMTLAAS